MWESWRQEQNVQIPSFSPRQETHKNGTATLCPVISALQDSGDRHLQNFKSARLYSHWRYLSHCLCVFAFIFIKILQALWLVSYRLRFRSPPATAEFAVEAPLQKNLFYDPIRFQFRRFGVAIPQGSLIPIAPGV
jgi:hypothetical protein